ncbi:MAG: hypothetical protein RCG15_05120 [Candidatus Rickettsia vulgarisii]
MQFNDKGVFNLNGGIIEGNVDSIVESDTILNFNEPATVDLENAKDFTYNAAVTVNAHNNITSDNINFNNQKGVLNIADGRVINSNIIGGANSTIEFEGNGSIVGTIDNLGMLKLGSGNVDISSGNHNITEIQGNGTQELTFADDFNL